MQHHLNSINKHSIVQSRFKVKLINFLMIILHFSDSNTYNKYSNAWEISKSCYIASFIYRQYNLCLKSSNTWKNFFENGRMWLRLVKIYSFRNSKSIMDWRSFRVPYFRIYLEFFDKINGEFLGHIDLAKYTIKRKSLFYWFSLLWLGSSLNSHT